MALDASDGDGRHSGARRRRARARRRVWAACASGRGGPAAIHKSRHAALFGCPLQGRPLRQIQPRKACSQQRGLPAWCHEGIRPRHSQRPSVRIGSYAVAAHPTQPRLTLRSRRVFACVTRSLSFSVCVCVSERRALRQCVAAVGVGVRSSSDRSRRNPPSHTKHCATLRV